eukprot:TRINITY_DN3690_c0_g3_i1.p1 TRINITY_DN3690_c0_g3~~TRINITY_DN3690_c0_g3_i1.p1  ORF type:complete len:601 (-),score=73.53 TRINITY_DN3690_c0_g3_i1:58-1860(-)
MREYDESNWGFNALWGIKGSVFPRAVVMAVPSAIIAYLVAMQRTDDYHLPDAVVQNSHEWEGHTKNLTAVWGAFTTVLFFLLQGRTNTAYSRWWEGGTLLQQVRGEWFNAYSSLIAFSSTDPKMNPKVEEFHHLLARFMSLLFCSGLQQVSPNQSKNFEVLDTTGIDQESMMFLQEASDKVEVILQWIQRSTILNMSTGVLPIPPPVMSRAFQELSRGIVNLQNARKIADFPYPYPNAQTCMVTLVIHWWMSPFVAAMLLSPILAALATFLVIFFVWSLNFIALQLERPFGERPNDLPMDQMQTDWNQSLGTLLATRAQSPPSFCFARTYHRKLDTIMSEDVCCRGHVDDETFDRQVRRLLLPDNSFIGNRSSTSGDRGDDGKSEAISEAPRRESSHLSTSKQTKADRKTGCVKLIENVVMRLTEMERANNSSDFIETCKEKTTSKPAMSEITVTTQTGASSAHGGASQCSDRSRIRGEAPERIGSEVVEGAPLPSPSTIDDPLLLDEILEGATPQEPGEPLSSFKARMDAAHRRMLDQETETAASLAEGAQSGDSACDGVAASDAGRCLSRGGKPCGIAAPPNPRAFMDSVPSVSSSEP